MSRLIIGNDDYVRVYENCKFRGGYIVVLQVSKEEWKSSKYDKYR